MDKNVFERLEKEHEELLNKANKLSAFIESEHFKKLDQLNQHLLVLQSNTMMAYLNVLSIRLGVNNEVDAEQPASGGDTV